MAAPAPTSQQQGSMLQQQAIAQARMAFSKLPKEDAIFQECIQQQESLIDVVKKVLQQTKAHKKKKSSLLLEKFQKYTLWLQKIGDVVDIAVQTQAGIACPIWAPVKFVLKVSNDHSQAVERVINLVETISVSLPRFEIYERLQTDDALQAALLNVFTDIAEYSVSAFRFFKRGTLARLSRSVGQSYDQELGEIVARLERHSRAVDHTAVAAELLKASQYRTQDFLNHRKEMKLKCEKWLSPANIKEVHERHVRARSSRTCTWISNDERYKRWECLGSSAISDRCLSISGTNGCGKSVLSSYIVEHLDRQQRSTLHFAFSSTGTCQRTAADMTRTLLWQLLHNSADEKSVDIVHELMSRGQLVTSDLWEALGKILDLSLAPVFCVVDGIDECDDFDRTVVERLFKTLYSNPVLHIVLLGRPPAIQNLSLTSTFTVSVIEITAAVVSQDIEAYIEDEIARSQLLSVSNSRDEISHILHEKSDGMFLWVRLTIDDLLKAATKFELMERIHKLPRGLENVYRSILLRLTQNLDSFELHLAQNILGFTTVCCRPLTYDQLRYAHALDLRSRCCSSTPRALDEFLILQPIQQIIDLCGGLIFEADGVVRLIHSSVKDFLVRPPDQWSNRTDSELSNFRVAEIAYHSLFSHVCLDYLNTAWDTNLLRKPGGLQNIHNNYPFLKYAALHGVYHLNRLGPPSSTLLGKLQTLMEAIENDFWVVYWVSLLLDDASLEMLELMMVEYMSLDVWIGCHIDPDLVMAFYRHVGQELITRTQNLSPSHHLSAHWQIVLEFARDLADSDVHIYIEDEHAVQPNQTEFEATSSLKPLLPHLSTSALNLDPSRIVGLINSRIGKSLSRRIAITLALNMLLRRSTKVTDPLRRLLQLLLAKASDIPLVVLDNIAYFYMRLSKFETAIQFFDAALSKIDGQNTAKEFGLHDRIGICYWKLRDHEKALHHYELAHTGMEYLFGKQHAKTYKTLTAKCRCLFSLERYEDSLECDLSLVLLGRAIYGDNHEKTFEARYWEGRSLHKLRRYDEALASFQTASATTNMKLKSTTTYFKAEALYELGRYEEALRYSQEVLAIATAEYGENDEITLESMYCVGRTLYKLNRYEEAFTTFRELVKSNKVVYGENDESTLDSIFWLGCTLCELNRYEEAFTTFRELVKSHKVVYGENGQITLESIAQLLDCLFWLHRYDDALLLAGKHDSLVTSNPGRCLFKLRRYDEALLWFQNYQNVQKERLEEVPENMAEILHWVGCCLYELYRNEEALLWFQKTLDTQRVRLGNDHENTNLAVYWVGACFYSLHRYEEALKCIDSHSVRIARYNLFLMAKCHVALSQYSKALDCLEEICLDGDRHGQKELFLVATCHEGLSQYEKASTYYVLAYNIAELDVLD